MRHLPRGLMLALVAAVGVTSGCSASGSTGAVTPSASAPPLTPSPVSISPTAPPASPTTTPPTSHLAAGITLHVARPSGIVAGYGALWVQSRVNRTLLKISPTGHALAVLPHVSSSPPRGREYYNQGYVSLAAGFGSIWTVVPGAILKIDPSSATVTQRIKVPFAGANATLAVGLGAVWATNYSTRLLRIDPDSGAVTVVSEQKFASAAGMAISGGFVWLPEISEAGGTARFDPQTHNVKRIDGNAYASFVVGAFGKVWLGYRSGVAGVLDSATGRLRPGPRLSPRPKAITGVTFGLGRVFMNAGSLVVIHPQTHHVQMFLGVSLPRTQFLDAGIAVLGRRVWMVDPGRGEIRGIAVCLEIEC
jgi:streptogramin lyase